MGKNLRNPSSSRAASAAGKVLSKPSKTAKTLAASVLTQRLSKASVTSKRVIKETSSDHSDALKRLVDR